MRRERRNVILFLDNATVHTTSLIDMYNNIKVVFVPKNRTSRLQTLDPGIIQSVKTKYQKNLLREVMARTYDDLFASEIAKGINTLQAIIWTAHAWKEVSIETIKNYFAKCGITELTSEDEDDIVDKEFNAFFNELADSECDMTAEEYVSFNVETWSSLCAPQSTPIVQSKLV